MKSLKIVTKFLLVLLAICAVIAFILGGFAPLFSIAFGILIVYYLVVLVIINFVLRNDKPAYRMISLLLFVLPFFWAMADLDGLIDFLLGGIRIDMK